MKESQIQQIVTNIVEKGQVKRLTQIAMADQGPNFNENEFEKEYRQLTSLRQLPNR